MFDYHMHSIVSFDGHNTHLELAQAAQDRRPDKRRVGKETRSRWSPYH